MPNQYQSLASGAAIVKTQMLGTVTDQFNNSMPLTRALKKETEGWAGSIVNRSLRLARNNGVGATSDGGLLPAIGRQGTATCTMSAAYNYLRFGVTGVMLKSARGGSTSYAKEPALEMEKGLLDLQSSVNRQFGWNGNGSLAQVNASVVASQTVDLIGRTGTNESAAKFIAPGMVIDFANAAGTAYVAQGRTIQSMSTSGSVTTITLDSPVTVTATDIVITANSLGCEIAGIITCQDGATTTLNNISRTQYPIYQGNLVNLANAQLSLYAMEQTAITGRERGGADYKAIMCDFSTYGMVTKLLQADKRYVNTQEGPAGFKYSNSFMESGRSYITFDDIPVIADKDFAPNMVFIDPKTYVNYVLCEFDWADESGSDLIAQPEVDAYEGRLRYFTNIMPIQPNASARLINYVSP